MNVAFTPDEMITLGKALDRIIEKYGPLTDLEKEGIAERLLRLAAGGIPDIDQLVEMGIPPSKWN